MEKYAVKEYQNIENTHSKLEGVQYTKMSIQPYLRSKFSEIMKEICCTLCNEIVIAVNSTSRKCKKMDSDADLAAML